MSLLLTTPEQHDFQDPTLELDEKRLQRWLAGLPVLNPGESLRMVVNALEPLNEQRLDIAKRLSLLRVYQSTVNRLFVAAEPLRLRQQPLSRQQRETTVNDVERLCLAMANGYKIAIKQLHAGGRGTDAARLAAPLRAALQQLAAALVHSYRYYRREPPFVFLEINQLYRLARHQGLHDGQVDDEHSDTRLSIAGLYQALCLFSLCDPFALQEGLADAFYAALTQYAESARVVPGNSWQGVPEGLYFVDLQSDSRPRHCVFLASPVAGDEPHILDARGALQQMHTVLAALPADRRSKRPEAGILRALLPEVSPGDKRRSERRPDGRWIGVVCGLDAITEWVSGRLRGESPDAEQWQVKDASDEGYCLAEAAPGAHALSVGDLMCVVTDSARQEASGLQLMVVRWLHDARGEGVMIGVEHIAGVPGPVGIVAPEQAAARPAHALFIPSDAQHAARLIAPREVYAENRRLLLYVGDREIAVRCARLLEEAPAFECFEFTSGG